MLSQTYILYFYISTGNLILNLLLFQEASLHFFFFFFPCFTGFPDLPNIYFTREKNKEKARSVRKSVRLQREFFIGLRLGSFLFLWCSYFLPLSFLVVLIHYLFLQRCIQNPVKYLRWSYLQVWFNSFIFFSKGSILDTTPAYKTEKSVLRNKN